MSKSTEIMKKDFELIYKKRKLKAIEAVIEFLEQHNHSGNGAEGYFSEYDDVLDSIYDIIDELLGYMDNKKEEYDEDDEDDEDDD